jgi:hypothetical protein
LRIKKRVHEFTSGLLSRLKSETLSKAVPAGQSISRVGRPAFDFSRSTRRTLDKVETTYGTTTVSAIFEKPAAREVAAENGVAVVDGDEDEADDHGVFARAFDD